MKKILFLSSLSIFLFSCVQENELEGESNNQPPFATVDSSYSLIWNNQKLLLRYDTAEIYYTQSEHRNTEGCGPAWLHFRSVFTEMYTHTEVSFILDAGRALYWELNSGYPQYYAESEANYTKQRLTIMMQGNNAPATPGVYISLTGKSYQSGEVYIGENDSNPTTATLTCTNVNIYDRGLDRICDYTIEITGEELNGEFSGRFIAPNEYHQP